MISIGTVMDEDSQATVTELVPGRVREEIFHNQDTSPSVLVSPEALLMPPNGVRYRIS
ncbi:MAG TPA: hypothetical protein QGF35_02130 [Dehalococcoidia bacterium]|nr:hypothetical protein [Dehalococcoidia bacterium]